MINSKSYYKQVSKSGIGFILEKFSLRKFLVLVFIFTLLFMLRLLYSKYNSVLAFIVNRHELKTSCSFLTFRNGGDRDVLLLIDVDHLNHTYKINNIEYIFWDNNSGAIDILDLRASDWVRLYFQNQNYSQVQYLMRALNQNSLQGCYLFKELTYLTGIVPTRIIYRLHNKQKRTSFWVYNIGFKDYLVFMRAINKGEGIHYVAPDSTKVILEDGTVVNAYVFSNIFPLIKNLIRLPKIEQEGVSVEIYNATNKSGYATFWSKVLTGMGFNVNRVGTAVKRPVVHGTNSNFTYWVYVSNKAKSTYSFKYLSALLGGNKIYFSHTRPDSMVTTGDIVVILLQ